MNRVSRHPHQSCVAVVLAALLSASPAWAGSLEPAGMPGPTMKTLDEIPGSWSRKLASGSCSCSSTCASERWRCVLGGEGVLDLETGLVWEQLAASVAITWAQALDFCSRSKSGGRMGWRLPTAAELGTLVDPSAVSPGLPAGHPFNVDTSKLYWTATTSALASGYALAFDFPNTSPVTQTLKTAALSAWWCVRGGSTPQAPQ